MSTQKGNAVRKRPQKHQNSFAFKIKKKFSPIEEKLLEAPTSQYLCPSCEGIIQWKKQYKKYKPLSVPRRCSSCSEKTVVFAYMLHCENCAKAKDICAKCSAKNLTQLKALRPAPASRKGKSKQKDEEECCHDAHEMSYEEIVEHFPEYEKELQETGRLAERTLRTVQRRLDKGEGHSHEEEEEETHNCKHEEKGKEKKLHTKKADSCDDITDSSDCDVDDLSISDDEGSL